MSVELSDDLILCNGGTQVATLAPSHFNRKINWLVWDQDQWKKVYTLLGCSMFAKHVPTMVLFKDFIAHANGRHTPMGKEKIRLEQDVSFET